MTAAKSCWFVSDLRDGETARIQNKVYPLVGARLRLLRENFPDASIATEILPSDSDMVLIRATVTCGARSATALGTSSALGDKALADSLFELAETRAIARSLRFFGLALDSTGAEEVQGRRPIMDRERDEPAPLKPGEKPSPGQLAELRALVQDIKKAGKKVPDHELPETAQDAADLIELFTKTLGAKQ